MEARLQDVSAKIEGSDKTSSRFLRELWSLFPAESKQAIHQAISLENVGTAFAVAGIAALGLGARHKFKVFAPLCSVIDDGLRSRIEMQAARWYPGNEKARELLLKQASGKLNKLEEEELKHQTWIGRRSPQLEEAFARYFKGDSTVRLLPQDSAIMVKISPGEERPYTFLTQRLTSCKACFGVFEHLDNSKTIVFSHFQPGNLTENLRAIDKLVPDAKATAITRAQVLTFVPDTGSWPVSYRNGYLSRSRLAANQVQQVEVLREKFLDKVPNTNFKVESYSSQLEAHWGLGDVGTLQLRVPGKSGSLLDVKAWYRR